MGRLDFGTTLGIVTLLAVGLSVAVLFYRYIVLHDYEVLILSPEEAQEFILENSTEEEFLEVETLPEAPLEDTATSTESVPDEDAE